ncbi:MAG: serine/threonine protein kinase [Lachnospiraceae bacterium]|nr:serine/threonine protein kinase [Lachnospiraceae bacterium]
MLEIGSIVDGKYKVLTKVGQGGMSIVYLAMNERANKQWAIKEVRKDGVKDFEVVKQGLVVETDMLKRLNHSYLPSIIDVIDQKDNFLIVMDYIEGNPLSQKIEEYGAQPQELVIKWAKQLCDVLGYLHTRTPAIIYRDMKPANVMLRPDGNITLIDFGTAREYKEQNVADTTCLGTKGYAAPEQFGGKGQTDARTDIYCLGVTLYHLVTGMNPAEPPYEIKPIRQINPALSSGLEKIILKCTRPDPDERYQSCAELMYALNHYDEIDDLYRRKQKRRVALFLTTLIMSGVCVGGGFYAKNVADSKTNEQYEYVIKQIENDALSDNEKLKICKNAIEVDASRVEAYNEYLKIIGSTDDKLDVDECYEFEQIYEKYKSELKNNKDSYVKVNLNYASTLCTRYEYGDGENVDTNASGLKKAKRYFKEVMNVADTNNEYYKISELFYNIQNINESVNTGFLATEVQGSEIPKLWTNVNELVNLTLQDTDSYKLLISSVPKTFYMLINTYIEDFKDNGIKRDEIETLHEKVLEICKLQECSSEDFTADESLYEKKMKATYGN